MITSKLLTKIFSSTAESKVVRFVNALNKFLPIYGITTFLRFCAFLATGGVETDYLRVTIEYASGAAYEGRSDLGNYFEGDGRKYKGRGFFQTTGRFNYWKVVCRFIKKLTSKDWSKDLNNYANFKAYCGSVDYSLLLKEADRLNVNFLAKPERLAEIEIAVESACIFWQDNNLNKYADAGDFRALSAVVNCGNPKAKPNHWTKRSDLYSRCKDYVPKDFEFAPAQAPIVKLDLGNGSSYTTQVEPSAVPSEPTNQQPRILDSNDPNVSDTVGAFGWSHFDFDKAQNQFQQVSEIAQRPSLKKVLRIAVLKLGGGLTLIWESGIGGRIALVASAVVILWVLGYVIYKYRAQIKNGFSNILSKFKKQ